MQEKSGWRTTATIAKQGKKQNGSGCASNPIAHLTAENVFAMDVGKA